MQVTLEHIDSLIESKEFYHHDSKVKICFLKLKGDFYVIGESGVLDRTKFNSEIGEKYALENAKNKVWQLEGYKLALQNNG